LSDFVDLQAFGSKSNFGSLSAAVNGGGTQKAALGLNDLSSAQSLGSAVVSSDGLSDSDLDSAANNILQRAFNTGLIGGIHGGTTGLLSGLDGPVGKLVSGEITGGSKGAASGFLGTLDGPAGKAISGGIGGGLAGAERGFTSGGLFDSSRTSTNGSAGSILSGGFLGSVTGTADATGFSGFTGGANGFANGFGAFGASSTSNPSSFVASSGTGAAGFSAGGLFGSSLPVTAVNGGSLLGAFGVPSTPNPSSFVALSATGASGFSTGSLFGSGLPETSGGSLFDAFGAPSTPNPSSFVTSAATGAAGFSSLGSSVPGTASTRASSTGSGSIGSSNSLPFGGHRAMGGPVDPSAAYLVGEQGPEILMGASGMIASNSASRRMLDNPTQVAYYTIDARGTDPVLTEQRVRQSLIAVHGSAVQKSIQMQREQTLRTPQK